MDLQNISIISFGFFEKDFLDAIAESVIHEFSLPVKIKEGHMDLIDSYDPSRRQYNGNKLLKEVDAQYASDDSKTFGMFNIDLFIPILTYIFGQAFLNGRTGIASIYRFSNERYGMKKNEMILLERFKKEVIHELGHTFGLIHCFIPDCVMRSSTYVEDVDQKGHSLCPKCRAELGFL